MTKEQFINGINKYPPSGYVVWAYKYFSTDLNNMPLGSISAIISFVVATSGMIVSNEIGATSVAVFFCLFYIPFAAWGFITLPAFIMNNRRLIKICRYLNIKPSEYNFYRIAYGI